jgi:creatinine amidohydrolase
VTESRYERLHPAELAAIVEKAPVSYVPIGTLEFHGPHLPFGVDSFEAHGLCLRAAARTGGVVLPPVYLACGCLDMQFTLSFSPDLVYEWVRATIGQLVHRGFRVVVVLAGHGPLDLNHLLKRACAEAERDHPGVRAYGLCWLELNAARLTGPEPDEPTVVDHAARIETSWMLELHPDLVLLDRLPDDPAAAQPGVYGLNPRFTASREFGQAQLRAATELLAERVRALLSGQSLDTYGDLRRFVELGWSEPLELRGIAGPPTSLVLTNPGRSSRYLSSFDVQIDGTRLDPESVMLVNASPGETGAPIRAGELAPERGFYVRRGQEAKVLLDGVRLEPGAHRVRAEIGLGGVTSALLDEVVTFT